MDHRAKNQNKFENILVFWRLNCSKELAQQELEYQGKSWHKTEQFIRLAMLNSSYNNSLTRSPSILNSATRSNPSPKCFGRNTHVIFF